MSYAETTRVPINKTKADIETLVERRGATAFGIMQRADAVQVAFVLEERNILFRLTLPDGDQKRRSRWRALFLVIKAKLESIEAGIETVEEAFLGQVVMPDGRTVYETASPMIAKNYEGGGVPLLPGPGAH